MKPHWRYLKKLFRNFLLPTMENFQPHKVYSHVHCCTHENTTNLLKYINKKNSIKRQYRNLKPSKQHEKFCGKTMTRNELKDSAQKMKFSIMDFFSKCDKIRRLADLVTFTEDILNGTLHFLCSESYIYWLIWLAGAYLEPYQTSQMEYFCENS